MSGYFMVQAPRGRVHASNPLGCKILIEVLGRADVREVARGRLRLHRALEGESKVTWRQYVEYLGHLFRLRVASRSRIQRLSRGAP